MSRIRTSGLDNVTGQHRFYNGSTNDTIMGAPSLNMAEVNLGSVAHRGGHFDIAGTNLTVGRTVIISQAAGPYTGKGTLPDEAEMDQALTTGYILDSSTIRCYWSSDGLMKGNVKFNYQVITQQ